MMNPAEVALTILAVVLPTGPVQQDLQMRAVSAAGAVFLILEMNSPFTGLITLSSAPMQEALHSLGR